MKNYISIFLGFLFVLDLIFLICFGEAYSKFSLRGQAIYLHETILLLVGIGAVFLITKENKRIISIEIMFGVAILYLFIAILKNNGDLDIQMYYIVRQFMIFGYGILLYLIVINIYAFKEIEKGIAKFLGFFGILCVAIQVMYIFYYIIAYQNLPFFERNYYSPMVIMGLIVASGYILAKEKNPYLKHLFFLGIFIISLSVGHDSMVLSIGLVYFIYFFLRAGKRLKIITLLMLVGSIISLIAFVPSFADVNAQWRMLYWKEILLRLTDNYFIFGDGFGVPYVSAETADRLNTLMTSNGHDVQILADDKYLIAPHNSFLTMTVHLGILPILLLIYPLLRLIKNKWALQDKEILFLFLSLVGVTVFSSFNVILELPHSSQVFWIVYFVLIFKLEKRIELPPVKAKFC